MNPFLKFFILICIDIYIFTKFGKIYGFLGLGIILYRFLDMLGIIRSPKIFRGAFPEGIVYLKDYQGKPYNSPEALKEAADLIKNYKLNNYLIIVIFYDRPGEIPFEKQRCSVGIYKKNTGFPDPVPKEFENYCKANNYYSVELPNTTCIFSRWDFTNGFAMITGYVKFRKIINDSLKDAVFRKMYRVNESSSIVVELFASESRLEFYIPTVNEDKFLVYRKEDKPKNE